MSIISTNFSLQEYNTFGIDVNAAFFTEFVSKAELKAILSDSKWQNISKLILGGGSNVLLTKDFDGLVLKNGMMGIEVINEDEKFYYVKAQAGEQWHNFVQYCINQNMGGVENLSLIPGSVGASPMQNIGAYGVELCDVFHSLEAIDMQTLTTREFTKEECQFGYRESIFKKSLKNRYIILSVTFQLSKRHIINASYGAITEVLKQHKIEVPSIKDISDAVIAIRSSKLPNPKQLGNAGSFFKNPEINHDKFESFIKKNPSAPSYKLENDCYKIPAGWLIEQCGWKGKHIGHTGSHKDQALVLVNYGGASGEEIWQLAMSIQQSVKDRFDIEIQTEVNIY